MVESNKLQEAYTQKVLDNYFQKLKLRQVGWPSSGESRFEQFSADLSACLRIDRSIEPGTAMKITTNARRIGCILVR